jgi:hypothetical protein
MLGYLTEIIHMTIGTCQVLVNLQRDEAWPVLFCLKLKEE